MTTVRSLQAGDEDGLTALFAGLSENDTTVMREDFGDVSGVARLIATPELRWVAFNDDDEIVGYATVNRLPGLSNHVGELRLVVDSSRRGGGVGTGLARRALTGAVQAGIRKVVIELTTESERAIEMFSNLGFEGEALLRDHIRDRSGEYRDVVVLAHNVAETWANLETVGIADELMS